MKSLANHRLNRLRWLWKWSGRLSWFWLIPLGLWVWAAWSYTENYPMLGCVGGLAYGAGSFYEETQNVGVLFENGDIELKPIGEWYGGSPAGMVAAGVIPECEGQPVHSLVGFAFLTPLRGDDYARTIVPHAIRPEQLYLLGTPCSYMVDHTVFIEEYQPLSESQRAAFRAALVDDWALHNQPDWTGWVHRSTQDAMNAQRLDLLRQGDGQTRVPVAYAFWRNTVLEVLGWLWMLLHVRFCVFVAQGVWTLVRWTHAEWRNMRAPGGRCVNCKCDLRGLTRGRCPECGVLIPDRFAEVYEQREDVPGGERWG